VDIEVGDPFFGIETHYFFEVASTVHLHCIAAPIAIDKTCTRLRGGSPVPKPTG
jgi:hypothetical protein